MPASIAWRDTDNATVITSWTADALLPQGQRYSVVTGSWKKFWVYNDGDTDFTTVNVDIAQVGTDNGYQDAIIAPDNGSGAPDTAAQKTAGQGGVNLGALAVGASSPIWLDINVDPARSVGTHQFQLLAAGTV